VAGNYFDKYRSKNPVYLALVGDFLRRARELLRIARPVRALEVGCAQGDLAFRLFGEGKEMPVIAYTGIDLSPSEVSRARERFPGWSFRVASAYDLPFPDSAFDLVIACEVLEHLDRPAECLREVERVCGSHVLLSVPWEPVWRVLNLARGKYWACLGNTPGHVQHFSRRCIRRLVSARFEIVAERRPIPWTMLLARRQFVARPARRTALAV
jgi:ubiquinone/menaquinone biosynthesis C-methylase UbiE